MRAILLLAATTLVESESSERAVSGVESAVLAALESDDVALVHEAASFLEEVALPRHLPALAKAAAHREPDVRYAAFRALGFLADRNPDCAQDVARAVAAGANDVEPACRFAAVVAFDSCPALDRELLDYPLGDPAVEVRLWSLVEHGRRGIEFDRADLQRALADAVDTPYMRMAADCLALLEPSDPRELLTPYLEYCHGVVQFRAKEAGERLDAVAGGAPKDWLPKSQRAREEFRARNAAAERALSGAKWTPISMSELLAAAAASRLVLFGEVHSSEQALRGAQIAVTRAMANEAPDRFTLGFEPSVEGPQRPAIDVARELGVEVIAVEHDWQDLLAHRQYAERDDQAAEIIARTLDSDLRRRMLVLRGEGHTLPGGHLDRKLGESAMIILTTHDAPLDVYGDDPSFAGRVHRIGDSNRVFHIAVRDRLAAFPVLRRWIESQLNK